MLLLDKSSHLTLVWLQEEVFKKVAGEFNQDSWSN